MHTKFVQHRYTFIHKVFYKRFTHPYLMVFAQTAKDVRCKTKIRDTLMPQKWSIKAEVLLSLQKQLGEPSE